MLGLRCDDGGVTRAITLPAMVKMDNVHTQDQIADISVSIITVSFNAETTIDHTLRSVAAQTYPCIEYLVIDGGSTDGTLTIVDRYRDTVDVLVSERDRGIGDAWNKGIERASGELILLLNADDELLPDSVEQMVAAYRAHDRRQAIYYGVTEFIDGTGRPIGTNRKAFDRKRLAHGFGFMFTTCIFPRRIWQEVGRFDTTVSIAVDTDWLMRALACDIKLVACDYRIRMREGGVSDKFKRRAFAQYHAILRRHGFSQSALVKARLRHEAALAMVALRRRHPWLMTQAVFTGIRLANILYNLTPFFALKRRVARTLRMSLGRNTCVHGPLRTFGLAPITIGDHSVVNRACYLDNRAAINIGDSVSIAHNVRIYTGGHDIDSSDFAYTKAPVSVQDFVVIFANAIVQPGITIGKGAVVLPGAVVTRDVLPFSVVGGNPARHVRERRKDLDYTFHYDHWVAP